MARNDRESPLLGLPGEIRNKIYEFAVGGHIIVIKYHDSLVTSSAPHLSAEISYHLITPLSSLVSTVAKLAMEEKSSLAGSTKMPKNEALERPSRIFGIDLVCRQIRAETSQIQYKHNIFHFDNHSELRMFAAKLSIAQRNAITKISAGSVYLCDQLMVLNLRGMELSTRYTRHPYSFRTILPNLKRFYFTNIFLPVSMYDTEEEKIAQIWEILGTEKKRDDGLEMILVEILDRARNIKDAKKFTIRA